MGRASRDVVVDCMVLSSAMVLVVASTDDLVEPLSHSKGDFSDLEREDGHHLASLDCGEMRSMVLTSCLEVNCRSRIAWALTTNRMTYRP